VPLPEPGPGYDPAGDALQLFAPGLTSPARSPIPGVQILDSFGEGSRFVVRVPDDWNGKLAVCGTPATRSEYANDLNLGDYLLARGYAFASSNKGLPFNGIVEPAARTPDRGTVYPVPFNLYGMRSSGSVVRFGSMSPRRVPVGEWHEDMARLTRAARSHVRTVTGRQPRRTYALGLSMGGGQVRWLLERHPELADGGVEWAAVHWSPQNSILDYLPTFLKAMPDYVRSGFRDAGARAAIEAAGFPPDRLQDDPAHPSLWNDHYANLSPFYADVTTFMFAMLLDPELTSDAGDPPNVADPVTGEAAGETNARGFALPEARRHYVPSAAARAEIAGFGQTGSLERPMISIAGEADVFVTPQRNATSYLEAVRAAGRGDRYWQYLVRNGTHVDAYASYGYGLQPMLPFVWAAIERLERVVEHGDLPPGAGTARSIAEPREAG
jgi:hypothetical protein